MKISSEQACGILQSRIDYMNDRLDEHSHNNTARCMVVSSIDEIKHIANMFGIDISDRNQPNTNESK